MARTIDEKKRLDLAYQAFDVVARKGLFKTNLTEVARELDMKRTTLYWYFKSISQIIIKVLRDVDLKEKEYLDKVTEGVDDTISLLTAHMLGSYDFFKEKELYLTLITQLHGENLEPEIQEYLDDYDKSVLEEREELQQLLQEGVRQGELRPHNSEHIADACRAYVTGLLLHGLEVPLDGRVLLELFVIHCIHYQNIG